MSIARIQQIAEKFETIDLTEMDQVQLMNRVDTKFSFSKDELVEILPLLASDYRILSVNGVLLSEYESLYYDSKKLNFYTSHHRNRVDRFKVRFRKYVNSNISFLEVKHKVNGRTVKNRIPSNDIPLELNNDQQTFVKDLGIDQYELIPSLWNSFRRITLVNKDMSERLTLDIGLTFKWNDDLVKEDNIVIAELKQEKLLRTSPFYKIMKRRLIRPLRLSKYCIGIIKLYGKKNVKYNRFKKKLLKLDKIKQYAA